MESVYAMSVFGLQRNGFAVVLSEGWWCFYPGSKLDLKFCDLLFSDGTWYTSKGFSWHRGLDSLEDHVLKLLNHS